MRACRSPRSAGLHAGCYELFAREPIRSISDLKGRRVGIQTLSIERRTCTSRSWPTHVGLDPNEDIEWVVPPDGNAMELFAEGKTDAFLGFPPEPQELRARGIDRVILSTLSDRPWSQYFCCMIYGNRAWVRDHPVATKRFLRAVFKAADFCQAEPENAARRLVDGGFAQRYDYALETIRELPYELLARIRLRRTPCGSTRSACTRRACSPRAPTRSSPRAPTGASSTSSSAS